MVWMILVMAIVFLAAPVKSVMAEEQVQTQSMIMAQGQFDDATQLRLRLKNQLRKETGLNLEEVEAIDPLLEEALRLNGSDPEPIRAMVRKALQMDCVGVCLMERLRTQNRLMLKEHKQSGEMEQAATQERTRTRTQTHDGEHSGMLTRTETRTQSESGSGSGAGNGNGKGK